MPEPEPPCGAWAIFTAARFVGEYAWMSTSSANMKLCLPVNLVVRSHQLTAPRCCVTTKQRAMQELSPEMPKVIIAAARRLAQTHIDADCRKRRANACEVDDSCGLDMGGLCHPRAMTVPSAVPPFAWDACVLNSSPLTVDARTVAECVFGDAAKCMYRHFIRYPSVLHMNRMRVRRELSCTQSVTDRLWWRVDVEISRRMTSKTFAVLEYATNRKGAVPSGEYLTPASHIDLMLMTDIARDLHIITVFLHRSSLGDEWSLTVSDPNHFNIWGGEAVARLETNPDAAHSMKRWCDDLMKRTTGQPECRKIHAVGGTAPNRFGDPHCFASVCLNVILLCRASGGKASNGTAAMKSYAEVTEALDSDVRSMRIDNGVGYWARVLRPYLMGAGAGGSSRGGRVGKKRKTEIAPIRGVPGAHLEDGGSLSGGQVGEKRTTANASQRGVPWAYLEDGGRRKRPTLRPGETGNMPAQIRPF